MSCEQTSPIVTVVIPAYNAEATISETLLSARRQTYRQLEIIVVDDGSTDATPELVRQQAQHDQRIRLIQQANAGVAAARNTGAAAATGEFIAPLDADDLWLPEKIERQMAPFHEGGPELGVVYAWSQSIDDDSRIIDEPRPSSSGWVLPDMALRNFIGNGSSPLIRMSAFRQTPGYDPTLKHRGGQGCEDRKLYLQLAAGWRFALVPEFLTLYRIGAGNMSSNVKQMLRSHDLVTADVLADHPDLAAVFHESRNRLGRFMLRRASRERRIRDAAALIISMAAHDPVFTRRTIVTLAKGAVQRRIGSRDPGGDPLS